MRRVTETGDGSRGSAEGGGGGRSTGAEKALAGAVPGGWNGTYQGVRLAVRASSQRRGRAGWSSYTGYETRWVGGTKWGVEAGQAAGGDQGAWERVYAAGV